MGPGLGAKMSASRGAHTDECSLIGPSPVPMSPGRPHLLPESPGDSADSEGLAPQNWCLFLQLRGFHAPVTKMRKLKYAECSHGILTVLSHLESLLTGHLMIQTSVKMTLLVVSLV